MCGKSCVGRLAVKTVSLFLIVCTISLLSSCGGGGSSSTTSGGGPNVPPPPTASLTFLQVTPGNASVAADRKSTRLNSSHVRISYAVFCLKNKKCINAVTLDMC